jgi:hypothetical protein
MIENTTQKTLEEKGFELIHYYGDCPVFEKDDIAFVFRNSGYYLNQMVEGYLNNDKPNYREGLYLTERIRKMETLIPLAFDYLPLNYNILNDTDRVHAYCKAEFDIAHDKLDNLLEYIKEEEKQDKLIELQTIEDITCFSEYQDLGPK